MCVSLCLCVLIHTSNITIFLKYSIGANHAFFILSTNTISEYSKVLVLMEKDTFKNLISMAKLLAPENIKIKIANITKDKKSYIEQNGHSLAVTQSLDIVELFNIGVRYFHVNIEYHNNGIYTTNSFLGDKFSMYIAQLEEILSTNTGEIVILHIEKTLFTIDERTFDSKVESLFKSTYKHITKSLKDITFSEIAASSSRLVVIYPRHTNKFWPERGNLHFRNDVISTNDKLRDIIDAHYDDSLINVIKAAVISNFDRIVNTIINTDALSLYAIYNDMKELSQINELQDDILSNANWKNKILSMNKIKVQHSVVMINKNVS